MIVVDTNIVAYLLMDGAPTADAEAVFERDPAWCAPLLWRSEFQNVLARRVQTGQTSLDASVEALAAATQLFEDREFRPGGDHVLRLAADSGCSAYDCEFVAVARDLAIPLVTLDRAILRAFPDIAVAARRFVG